MSTTMTTPQPQAQSVVVDDVPDPQVPERPRRRTYPARYKRDILAEYEASDRAGKGELLRREGLYTSLVSAWREQRDKGALAALGGRLVLHRLPRRRRKPRGYAARTRG